jgi:hypothetical protein
MEELWWSWAHKEILRAAVQAHALHWPGVMRAKLKEQGGRGLGGIPIIEMHELLRRSKASFDRAEGGKQGPDVNFFLGLAAMLDVPVASLYPPTDIWIANMTRKLCDAEVTLGEALTYARYRLRKLANPADCPAPPTDVVKVARALTPKLKEINNWLNEDRDKRQKQWE